VQLYAPDAPNMRGIVNVLAARSSIADRKMVRTTGRASPVTSDARGGSFPG
jgi:hypothetical protein